jgi:hypothetical protein
LGLGAQKNFKRSANEQLTQCAHSKTQSILTNCEDFKCDYKVVCALKYSDIQSVIIICKFRVTIYLINGDIKSRTHKLFDALPGNTPQYVKIIIVGDNNNAEVRASSSAW